MPDPLERSLPNSADSERAILGGILLDNRLMDQVVGLLHPEDLYVPSHRLIYYAMVQLHEKSIEINPILIGEILKRENSLERVGGISFITNLTFGLPAIANVAHYTNIVRSKALARQGIREAAKLTQQYLEEEDDPAEITAAAAERFSELREQNLTNGHEGGRLQDLVKPVEDHLYLIQAGVNPAISTGISLIDQLTGGGITPGEMWGIGALSSRGKSSLLVQLLKHFAKHGEPVALFSLEMKAVSLALRVLASDTGVAIKSLKPGMPDSQIAYLIDRARVAFDLPFWIYTDSECRSVAGIKRRLKVLNRKIAPQRIKAVGIDFYGLLSGYGAGRDRYENRTQELKYIATFLQQQIAIDENVGLIVPAQFNRSGWAAKELGPGNIDGGEAYFQACDFFAVLQTKPPKTAGATVADATLAIHKQRNGPTAMGKEALNLEFHRAKMEFHVKIEDEGEPVEEPLEGDTNFL